MQPQKTLIVLIAVYILCMIGIYLPRALWWPWLPLYIALGFRTCLSALALYTSILICKRASLLGIMLIILSAFFLLGQLVVAITFYAPSSHPWLLD